jgi:hypothetical protein
MIPSVLTGGKQRLGPQSFFHNPIVSDLHNVVVCLITAKINQYKLNIIHSVHFNSIFIIRQMYNLITLIV